MTATEPIDTPDDKPVDAEVVQLPSAALAVVEAGSGYLPQAAEWRQIIQQADILAQSDMVPSAYRGKPQNIVLATLAGRLHNWDAAMAMRSFNVIEGQPAMKPELQLALIRNAGHSVKGVTSSEKAVITGKRCDNDDEISVEFTLADAVRADLCQLKDGQTWARSRSGKKLPWEQYPEDMMWSRALSKLCRRLFSDVLLGAAYTPEELMGPGAWVERDGTPIEDAPYDPPQWVGSTHTKEPTEPETIDGELATALTARAQALPKDAIAELKPMFIERDMRGSIFSQLASKAQLIDQMITMFEKRAANGEWGEWSSAPAEPVSEPETDAEPVAPPENVDAGTGEIADPEPPPEIDESWSAADLITLPLEHLNLAPDSVLRAACTELGTEPAGNATHDDLVTLFNDLAEAGF